MSPLYHETLRPQFHFSARENWLNDPNGLVYYQGNYHLYFQHNPAGREWGNMTWGHALSPDLIHWKQLPHALEPDRMGTMFSGSAVVDWRNTSGLQQGNQPPIVVLYTAAGATSEASKGQPFTQCLAFSNDGGMTLSKYPQNPVLPHIAEDINGNRDPKVFWHAPTSRWIMVLYVGIPAGDRKDAQGNRLVVHMVYFFASSDLKSWTFLSAVDGFYECPDLIELPVDGDPKETRWVLYGADGQYWIGRFDGTSFVRESGFHKIDHGANYYAAQTYSDVPDGRRILIGWMRGGNYPEMPFNQQMTFPTTLELRSTPVGLRVHRQPVREIQTLRGKLHRWDNVSLNSIPSGDIRHDLLEIEGAIHLNGAAEAGFMIFGQKVAITSDNRVVTPGGSVSLPDFSGRLDLQILVDRTSIEVFIAGGRETISFCYLPQAGSPPLAGFSPSGQAHASLQVHELRSAW